LKLSANDLQSLLQQCAKNERLAQKELYGNYFSLGMSIALRYASHYDNAVEMVNDGFLKIFKDVINFKPSYDNSIASFTAWFKRIMVNACIDHLRKYKKKEEMLAEDVTNINSNDMQPTAEQMLQYKFLINCIQKLPTAYKTVFNLYVIEGYSHKEIAGFMNINEGTSKSNLFKARQYLQSLLQKTKEIHYERTV
jgi:RNA polymerase sigma factor (sigma-70 family)